MDELTIDPNAVIELQAQEIARLTHRAILAEAAIGQLRQQNAALATAGRDDEPAAGDEA